MRWFFFPVKAETKLFSNFLSVELSEVLPARNFYLISKKLPKNVPKWPFRQKNEISLFWSYKAESWCVRCPNVFCNFSFKDFVQKSFRRNFWPKSRSWKFSTIAKMPFWSKNGNLQIGSESSQNEIWGRATVQNDSLGPKKPSKEAGKIKTGFWKKVDFFGYISILRLAPWKLHEMVRAPLKLYYSKSSEGT